MTALAERDALVLACEKRAGEALVKMTSVQGLTLREAVRWCGEQVTLREATRLRQVAGEVGDTEAAKDDEKSSTATAPVAVAQVSTAR